MSPVMWTCSEWRLSQGMCDCTSGTVCSLVYPSCLCVLFVLLAFLYRDNSENTVLITLLTPNGGNDDIMRALGELLNLTSLVAIEFNNLRRFGWCRRSMNLCEVHSRECGLFHLQTGVFLSPLTICLNCLGPRLTWARLHLSSAPVETNL